MAAVAVVRVSGPEAWTVASRVFAPWNPHPLRATHGRYTHGDDGIALPFAEGHSYTGEEAVELSVHGSQESVRELVAACLAAGARMAEPGEFTQRAFLNGRIDLTQAEAVRDTIESRTEAQLRLANFQREGSLRVRVCSIRDRILKVLAAVEAAVDFSEEIGELDREGAQAALRVASSDIDRLLESAHVSRLLRQGIRIAIVGPPNAGKSSLLNAILGSDRAIVTDIPGTTRDFVEEQVEFNGLPVVLIDTAGLRESKDRIESLGIQRTRTIASQADHVWYVYDASVGWTAEDAYFVAALQTDSTVIANKADLAECDFGLQVSALHGTGLAQVWEYLPMGQDVSHREVAINQRHADHFEEAREAIAVAAATLGADRPTDLASVALQDALRALGQITGETASQDMISRIFSDFCIGK